jgi:hypothetical protein
MVPHVEKSKEPTDNMLEKKKLTTRRQQDTKHCATDLSSGTASQSSSSSASSIISLVFFDPEAALGFLFDAGFAALPEDFGAVL